MKKLLLTFIAMVSITTLNCSAQKDFLDLASSRYSVRHFSNRQVPEDLVDKIIQAGRVAPTAVNSQPQTIYVIKSADAMEKLNGISPCIYGAPHAFLICYDDARTCKRGDNGSYGEIDVTIVLTHMMLEAWNLGVGTCPVGYFDADAAIREFSIPEGIHPVLLLPFGYPAPDALPSKSHSSIRPVDETVKYL